MQIKTKMSRWNLGRIRQNNLIDIVINDNEETLICQVIAFRSKQKKCHSCGIFLKTDEGMEFQKQLYCESCFERKREEKSLLAKKFHVNKSFNSI